MSHFVMSEHDLIYFKLFWLNLFCEVNSKLQIHAYCYNSTTASDTAFFLLADSIHWYCHVLRREDGDVLRGALDFEAEGQRKKERLKRTWKKHVEEESMKVSLRREDAIYRSKWCIVVNQIATGLRRI